MIQEENRNMQICAHIQIRSGTYSCQFSNHPSLLERDAYVITKVSKKAEIQSRYALKYTKYQEDLTHVSLVNPPYATF